MFRFHSKTMQPSVEIDQDDALQTPSEAPEVPALQEETNMPTATEDIVVVDGGLSYANLQRPSDPNAGGLDSSLHTTASDASVDLMDLLKESEEDLNLHHASPKVDLSFRASQADSSELPSSQELEKQEYGDDKAVEDIPTTTSSSSHDSNAFVNVGDQLLKDSVAVEEANSTPPSTGFSVVSRIQLWSVVGIVLFAIMCKLSIPLAETIEIIEQEPEVNNLIWTSPLSVMNISFATTTESEDSMLEKATYTDEEEEESEADSMATGQLIKGAFYSFAFIVTLFSMSGSADTTDEPQETPSNDALETIPEDKEVPATKAKQELALGKDSEFDLSKYQALKVVDLRRLLRERKCTYTGRKHVLISRLAAVYKAQLESLTVKELRPKLKSKGLPQKGLKREIIQKLVEAGL